MFILCFFFFKQKTAYERRISDWSSDVCSSDLIGKLPGAKPDGKAGLFLGHWDHLGVCAPEGGADRICNGAVDNASGIAVLIEVAKRLGQGARPDRDIYFLATTAEAKGLQIGRASCRAEGG